MALLPLLRRRHRLHCPLRRRHPRALHPSLHLPQALLLGRLHGLHLGNPRLRLPHHGRSQPARLRLAYRLADACPPRPALGQRLRLHGRRPHRLLLAAR